MKDDLSINSCVLIISPEHWDAHTVSKHHYAKTLAQRSARVFYLNPPEDSAEEISVDKVEGYPGLYVVTAPKVASGLRFYPAILRRWLEKQWLARLEKAVATRIDVIWLFENSRFFDMRFACERLKIYHQVDLNQEFNPEIAASTADICFCTTDFIQERLQPFNPGVYKIHHGLAVVKNQASLTDTELTRFERKVPHAVYIGNLDMLYLDTELLASVAKQISDVQFHFVGGYLDDCPLRQLTDTLSNVTWWGRVESFLIPNILEQADILLVTYRATKYNAQLASPHKFMEYLASGKTIVATYTDEYKYKRDLLEMVDDSRDYAAVFERVVNNLSEYNSPERQDQRMAFAQAHTYDKQIDKIMALLKQHRLIGDERKLVL